MGLQRAPLLLLWAVLGFLVPVGTRDPSWHSLCYSYLKVSESSKGLPQFLSVIHLDDQPIIRYDILNGKTVPLVSWMEGVEVKTPERMFRADLEWLSKLNPQTGGLHTWQVIMSCKLREDGSKGGFLQYGYDGMDFIIFNKETVGWVTAQPQAQKVKEKWEENPKWSQRKKIYLEKTCIEWLQRFLSYQKEAPKKTEPPVGKVTHKAISDRLEVLTCQAFGFYPKEIQATWRRDGEVWKNEALHRNVAPNSDGTYYVWLSIEIDPKERHRFQCHLDHERLEEPLVLAFKEKTSTTLLVCVAVASFIIMGAAILFLTCYLWKFPHAMKTYLDHHPLEKRHSSRTSGSSTEGEIQSQAMLPPKMTSEGCCGQKTELRKGKERPLKASPDASSDNKEGAALETLKGAPEKHLEDAKATKPGTSEGPLRGTSR